MSLRYITSIPTGVALVRNFNGSDYLTSEHAFATERAKIAVTAVRAMWISAYDKQPSSSMSADAYYAPIFKLLDVYIISIHHAPTAVAAKQLGNLTRCVKLIAKSAKDMKMYLRGAKTIKSLVQVLNTLTRTVRDAVPDSVQLKLMYDILIRKFGDNADLKAALLATSPHRLTEQMMRGSKSLWNSGGGNQLGLILERVRSELAAIAC